MKRISPFILAIFQLQFLFLAAMSLYRYWFYTQFTPYPTLPPELFDDLRHALWYGLRLDLSILGYVNALALLLLALFRGVGMRNLAIRNLLGGYFTLIYVLIAAMVGADLAFYSYFGEHINIMVFGVFDDDTAALIDVARKNYNLPLIASLSLAYVVLVWFVARAIFRRSEVEPPRSLPRLWNVALFALLIALSLVAGRGSLGTFPISKNIKDVSSDPFINKLHHNGVYALIKAHKLYRQSKSDDYDLIKMMGYEQNITAAFAIHARGKSVDPSDLLASLRSTTPKNPSLERKAPHVVVVMVESFGLPITAYQSPTFDIMGRLKPHFDRDIVFKNFISGSNGTISSLEPVLLNIAARPDSTPFGQSHFLQTSFIQAAARVYQARGYETSFVYGGDLSWRNIGEFASHQGFDRVVGKTAIRDGVGADPVKSMHTWGIYDQYSYDYVAQKLAKAKKPQFVFLLTTNNHPPYDIPDDYVSRPLKWSPQMAAHMVGDRALLEKRLRDYAYALDMAGRFMDRIKGDAALRDTVVAITADNNTIEYGMKYDDPGGEAKRIPFYLYLPERLKPSTLPTAAAGSHKDLFPTLYHLTLSDADYISTGVNLLDPEALHCGFNNAGIILSNAGAFEVDKFKNPAQEECNRYYKATLAAGEYLIRSHDRRSKLVSGR